eukprot:scaffold382_cov380-Prasinococcus_capsulatus_cf.AAC.26
MGAYTWPHGGEEGGVRALPVGLRGPEAGAGPAAEPLAGAAHVGVHGQFVRAVARALVRLRAGKSVPEQGERGKRRRRMLARRHMRRNSHLWALALAPVRDE